MSLALRAELILRIKALAAMTTSADALKAGWGSYMYFRQNAGGKNCFISVDKQKIRHNPFYKALKAKSFTANDIIAAFFLLDILQPGENLLCVSLWKGWMKRI